MPYAAITYDVKPGHEAEIRDVFSRFRRPESPVLHDAGGEPVGMLLGTGLFIQGGLMVRVIHYEGGTVEDVARHMSVQEGVHLIETELAPYLATPRETDTTTPEGFVAHFETALMAEVQQFQLPGEIAERIREKAFAGNG